MYPNTKMCWDLEVQVHFYTTDLPLVYLLQQRNRTSLPSFLPISARLPYMCFKKQDKFNNY